MRYSFKEIKRKFSGRKCRKMPSVMEVVKYYETLPPHIQTEIFFSQYNRDGNIKQIIWRMLPRIIIFVIVFIAFIFSSLLLLLLVDQTDELDVGKKQKTKKDIYVIVTEMIK